MPAAILNHSAARFCVVPGMGVPMFSLPALALAQASRSPSLAKPLCGEVTITRSSVASGATGMKSLAASNGSDLNSAWLTAVPLEISSSVCPSGAACSAA